MDLNNQQKHQEFLAAVYQDMALAERMVQEDRDYLHLRDGVGETVFHYLVVEGDMGRAGKLLEWGAEINTQDDFGDSPLSHAVMLGNLKLVEWLVAHGANLEAKTVNEDTALSRATENGRSEIFDFLIAQPRKEPIDYYYDDLMARQVHEDETLVMRGKLIELGLRSG
jgi:ankyrin repeat protein